MEKIHSTEETRGDRIKLNKILEKHPLERETDLFRRGRIVKFTYLGNTSYGRVTQPRIAQGAYRGRPCLLSVTQLSVIRRYEFEEIVFCRDRRVPDKLVYSEQGTPWFSSESVKSVPVVNFIYWLLMAFFGKELADLNTPTTLRPFSNAAKILTEERKKSRKDKFTERAFWTFYVCLAGLIMFFVFSWDMDRVHNFVQSPEGQQQISWDIQDKMYERYPAYEEESFRSIGTENDVVGSYYLRPFLFLIAILLIFIALSKWIKNRFFQRAESLIPLREKGD